MKIIEKPKEPMAEFGQQMSRMKVDSFVSADIGTAFQNENKVSAQVLSNLS